MSSCIVYFLTSPSRRCSTIATNWSNCETYPSISSNTIQDSYYIGCSFYFTSITLPWRVVICCCTAHCSWDLFILSTAMRNFIYVYTENACCCAFYNCASNFLSSGSSTRHSYVCELLSLSCLHSKERDLILTTVLLVVSSLWSRTSCGVLSTVWASNFIILD
jgi:hypothetical protein